VSVYHDPEPRIDSGTIITRSLAHLSHAVSTNMLSTDLYLIYVHILTRNPRTSGSNQYHSLSTTPLRQLAALLNCNLYNLELSIPARFNHSTRITVESRLQRPYKRAPNNRHRCQLYRTHPHVLVSCVMCARTQSTGMKQRFTARTNTQTTARLPAASATPAQSPPPHSDSRVCSPLGSPPSHSHRSHDSRIQA
jgi:hypothetical protein